MNEAATVVASHSRAVRILFWGLRILGLLLAAAWMLFGPAPLRTNAWFGGGLSSRLVKPLPPLIPTYTLPTLRRGDRVHWLYPRRLTVPMALTTPDNGER
jgi:hypothetical protein